MWPALALAVPLDMGRVKEWSPWFWVRPAHPGVGSGLCWGGPSRGSDGVIFFTLQGLRGTVHPEGSALLGGVQGVAQTLPRLSGV